MSPLNRFHMPMPERPFLLGRHAERPEPFLKLVEVRELQCACCGKLCRYESSTSRNPGAPEFLRAQPDMWMALVVDGKTDTLDVVVACSEDCVQKLLRE